MGLKLPLVAELAELLDGNAVIKGYVLVFSNSVTAFQQVSLAEGQMVGKCLLGFCSPPWPINELGFFFSMLFFSWLVLIWESGPNQLKV